MIFSDKHVVSCFIQWHSKVYEYLVALIFVLDTNLSLNDQPTYGTINRRDKQEILPGPANTDVKQHLLDSPDHSGCTFNRLRISIKGVLKLCTFIAE